MFATLATLAGWVAAAFVAVAVGLLAMNRESGLRMLQHRPEMLPQAMLVRYAGLLALAVIASLLNAPRILFAVLLCFTVIGFGDAWIYRRAGHPHWLHLLVGAAAAIGAVLAAFAIE